MKKDGGQEKFHIHTKISAEAYRKLKKLSEVHGSMQNVLEQAIDLMYLKQATCNPQYMLEIEKKKLDSYRLSHLMFKEYNMMVVGRQTFLSYISNLPEAPIKKNNAIELIEWYYDNKYHISQLSLFQICYAIKQLWIAGNYFTGVQIQPLDEDGNPIGADEIEDHDDFNKYSSFRLIFSHDFTEQRYGEYWIRYFTHVFKNEAVGAEIVDIRVRHQSFSFIVRKSKLNPKFS